ncbi:PREDICTED: protein OSB3, chloroplastic/mitochondrial-like [Ipomoea nil]|uniref:protein OSB3, chloroplastic/mitochondrial-like n=1 Tax=Ipomoea nil TaxID=35883 RepID=UPI000901A380|nr:PREDICTED: protein OSB3, chloroplastic/mitochondrial-like [Ipomoea nil]
MKAKLQALLALPSTPIATRTELKWRFHYALSLFSSLDPSNEKPMNFLTKAISTQLFNSSPSPTQSRKCIVLLQTLTALQQSSLFSSKSREPRVQKAQEPSPLTSPVSFNPPKVPKPENESKPLPFCEIPFHSNVSNSVDLIGFVDCPVQLKSLPDGRRVAKTVILSTVSSPSVSIPVVFQGDLAAIAEFHVKKNDCIYVSGQLSNGNHNQKTVHLLVQIMNFVVGLKRISGLENEDDDDDDDISVKQKKGNKKGFTRKTMNVEQVRNWKDLIKNPKQWKDYRGRKAKGSVKTRHPDFKNDERCVSLWLSNAPEWILEGLEGLEFSDS